MIPLIIFLFAIVSGVAIIIPAYPVIINQNAKGIKKIKKEGYVLLGCVILLVFLPLILYRFQSAEELERDGILRHDYAASILDIKNSFSVTSRQTDSIISDNLGRYGYKFDLANKKLIKVLADSAKTKVIMSEAPVLSITDWPGSDAIQFMGYEDDDYKFRANIVSSDAGSSFFEVTSSLAISDSTGAFYYIGRRKFLRYKSQLAKDGGIQPYFGFPGRIHFAMLFVWFRGNFRNIDSTNGFTVDDVYYYNWKSKTNGNLSGATRERLIKFISDNE